jgi:hypothetical protein
VFDENWKGVSERGTAGTFGTFGTGRGIDSNLEVLSRSHLNVLNGAKRLNVLNLNGLRYRLNDLNQHTGTFGTTGTLELMEPSPGNPTLNF